MLAPWLRKTLPFLSFPFLSLALTRGSGGLLAPPRGDLGLLSQDCGGILLVGGLVLVDDCHPSLVLASGGILPPVVLAYLPFSFPFSFSLIIPASKGSCQVSGCYELEEASGQ